MYEIYCNDHRLILSGHAPEHTDEWSLVLKYRGKVKTLHAIADTLEKRPDPADYWLYADDPESLWHDFRSLYAYVAAAGGVVRQEDDTWLFIQRRGYLDLPKGKLDPGEHFPEAARREVLEETGLDSVNLGPQIAVTWHAYREKQKRYLKETRWFAMSEPQGAPTPQLEEGISEVIWLKPEDYLNTAHQRYRNLDAMVRGLITAAG